MYVVIAYDINTTSTAGKARLRRVERICRDHAQRVQGSVFEASIDWSTFVALKAQLEGAVDPKEDSVIFYRLGRRWRERVDRIGIGQPLDPDGLFCI